MEVSVEFKKIILEFELHCILLKLHTYKLLSQTQELTESQKALCRQIWHHYHLIQEFLVRQESGAYKLAESIAV